MKQVSYTAPSAWASALINCDYSGLAPEDVKACNTWLAMNGLSFADCVACEDAGFLWSHGAFEQMPLGADCQNYTFLIRE